jgi:hypothetical protein
VEVSQELASRQVIQDCRPGIVSAPRSCNLFDPHEQQNSAIADHFSQWPSHESASSGYFPLPKRLWKRFVDEEVLVNKSKYDLAKDINGKFRGVIRGHPSPNWCITSYQGCVQSYEIKKWLCSSI